MNYWYLKEGDILGPMPAEEIAKDSSFTEDSLVCPQDKAEQAEFWKPAQAYAQDFASILSGDVEMEIPQEIALDDIVVDYSSEETPSTGEQKEEPKENQKEEEGVPAVFDSKEEPQQQEEKNPFDTPRPEIAPNIEDTISSHVIAPRLDADGDTLLEDIPAKAILGVKEDEAQEEDFIKDSSLPSEDTLEDTPILNIFERTHERQKTKELKDISDNIYDTYGADNSQREEIKIRDISRSDNKEKQVKNNKIYLLLIVMFVLVVIALLLALFGSSEEPRLSSPQTTQAFLPKAQTSVKEEALNKKEDIEDMPTTGSSAFLNTAQVSSADNQKALTKVKKYILPNGQTLEEYLNQKYSAYQTSWVADVLSGSNYYVHFNANKIRQEPIVYSFSIDLDKNEINGLNNLGMDLLIKGE